MDIIGLVFWIYFCINILVDRFKIIKRIINSLRRDKEGLYWSSYRENKEWRLWDCLKGK